MLPSFQLATLYQNLTHHPTSITTLQLKPMAFFTKLKKAKGAAEEHKKAAASVKEEKPKVPYKHIPVHAAQDALSATPTTIRAEVLRERIEKARRTRPTSQSSNRTALSGIAMYQSVNGQPRSRPASIASAPSHSRQGSLGKRTNSDLSIASMMNTYPEAASRGRQPARRDHFAQDSGAPAVPPVPEMHRPKYSSTSSRSSVTKRRSPLSAMSISEDCMYNDFFHKITLLIMTRRGRSVFQQLSGFRRLSGIFW